MFATPTFKDMTDRFSLRFSQDELESDFQKLKRQDYLRGKSITYIMLATIMVITAFTLCRIAISPYDAEANDPTAAVMTNLPYIFGALCELLICFTERFVFLRTIVLCILTFGGAAMGNAILDKRPTFNPRYWHVD